MILQMIKCHIPSCKLALEVEIKGMRSELVYQLTVFNLELKLESYLSKADGPEIPTTLLVTLLSRHKILCEVCVGL
jgi:hypothetical protein